MNGCPLNVAIIIASKGRPAELSALVPFLMAQTSQPIQVIFALTGPEDAPDALTDHFDPSWDVQVIWAPPGLTKQRNAGLHALHPDTDVAVFFDDDFLPSRYAIAGIATAFAANPGVAGLSGTVLADGIKSQGISVPNAKEMIEDWDRETAPTTSAAPTLTGETEGLYGCNMAVRLIACRDVSFDEHLPAYGWLEDLDFGARLPGPCAVTDGFAGVHLGTSNGRETNGERLGYSQIVNPYYLHRKGSITFSHAFLRGLRNFAANVAKAPRPEPWIDRKARLRGNMIGLRDVAIGRADPQRILNWRNAG